MSKKSTLREAINNTEQELEALEGKLARSQTKLLLAIIDGNTPDKTEVEYFKLYASLIEKERDELLRLNAELNNLK